MSSLDLTDTDEPTNADVYRQGSRVGLPSKNARQRIRADACLEGNDLLHCAVSLKDTASETKFDALLMHIYDIVGS